MRGGVDVERLILRPAPSPFRLAKSGGFGASSPLPLSGARGLFLPSTSLQPSSSGLTGGPRDRGAQRFQLGPPISAALRRRMTVFFAFLSFSSRKWRSHYPGSSLQRGRYLWTPDNHFAISGDSLGEAPPPPRPAGRRGWKRETRGWCGASVGTPVTVCLYVSRLGKTRRAVLLRRAGVASTGLSIRCRQSLNSQGISASDWRLAVRRDAHGLVRPCRIPGTAFNSVPRATGSEAPRMTANRDELTPSRRPV